MDQGEEWHTRKSGKWKRGNEKAVKKRMPSREANEWNTQTSFRLLLVQQPERKMMELSNRREGYETERER